MRYHLGSQVGLCKTVRSLAWYEGADFLSFYPRGFDLADKFERAAFIEDARQCAAEAVVKRAVEDGAAGEGCLVELPTLRLALKACLARLAADRALIYDDGNEAEDSGGAAGGSGGASTSKVAGGEDLQQQRGGGGAAAGANRAREMGSSLIEPQAEVACGPLTHEEWELLLSHRYLTPAYCTLSISTSE